MTPDEKAKEIEKMLTPELQGLANYINSKLPEGWGFGLMIFELGHDPDGPLLWVSSAIREDMLNVMKEFIERNK